VLTLDFTEIAGRVTELQRQVLERVPERHHAGHGAHQVAPLTLPIG